MKTNAAPMIRITAIVLALMAAALTPAYAQITVGGNGANTTDSTSYSGTDTLTKIGSNTVTLSANSTYSGGTFVNEGTLQVNSSGSIFTPNNPNTTYTVNSGATLSMGSGSTAALWGRSVTLNNGTLFNAVSDYNDALSSLTMSGGSVAGNAYRVYDENTWQLSGNNTIDTWIGYVTFGAPTGHTFNVTNGRTVMGGHISDFFAGGGPQFLQKIGNGTLVLTGANSYAGETRIQAGTLQVGNGGTSGTLGSGSVLNNDTLALNRSDNTTLGNSISGTGSVVKQGFGDVTFSGSNSYSGGLTVEQGIAWVSGQSNLGSGTITLGNANTGTGGRSDAVLLVSGSASTTITNNVVASAAATGASLSLGGIGTGDGDLNLWTGTINLGQDLNLRAENTTTRSTFAGQITGNGGITVSQGRITLENTNNNYAGGTTVNAGTILQLSGNEVLPNATDLTVNGSLTLASEGGTETIGRLSGNGSVSALLPGSYTMAIAHSGSATFGGTISNGAGTVSVIKSGAGTQTLAGNNTYTGGTTISGGTLQIGNGATSGAVLGNITNNATLSLNRSDAPTVANVISGTGSVVHNGSGTTALSAANTYTGKTVVNNGTLILGGSSTELQGASSGYDINNGTTLSFAGSRFDLNQFGGAGRTITFGSGGGNTFATGTGVNLIDWAGNTYTTTGGARNFISGSSGINLGDASTVMTLNVIRGTDATSDLTVSTALYNPGGLRKIGNGIATLSANSTYSGTTFVDAGTLQVNSSGANFTPNNPNTSYEVGSGATLSMGSGATAALWGRSVTLSNATLVNAVTDYNDKLSVLNMNGGVVTGNAYRVYDGDTWQLSGNNTIDTWVGYLTFGGSSPTGHTFNVTGGRTDMNGYISDYLADGGPQFLQKTGSGTLVLAGANTYAGETRIQAGTLQVGNGGTSGTLGSGSVTNNGAVAFNRSDNTTVGNTISGTGSVSKLGSGTMTLSGTSTYSGATTVNAGRLVVDGAIESSTVTVNSGATLSGSGSVGGLIVNSGGTINPGNSPGTQTVAGSATWNAGGNYNWQVLDVDGSAGSDWDLLNVTGTLDLSALSLGSQFNINLWSLSSIGPDVSGNALNFDSAQNYTWTIASAASGITGFAANKFNLNTGAVNGTGGFANALNGGSFSIAQSGNDLNLVFTAAVVPPGPAAVPEPGTWAAAALLAGGAYLRWRKRRQAHG